MLNYAPDLVTMHEHYVKLIACLYPYADVGFFLKGSLLSNNSIVLLRDIGEGSNALYCLTNGTECCSNHGTWVSPNGSNISERSSVSRIYIIRSSSSLLLNQKNDTDGSTGIYTCSIPNAEGTVQAAFIGVYKSGVEGQQYN